MGSEGRVLVERILYVGLCEEAAGIDVTEEPLRPLECIGQANRRTVAKRLELGQGRGGRRPV